MELILTDHEGKEIRNLQEASVDLELGAVSYTHLDVYKRQMHGPVGARDYGPKHLNYTSATARAEWTKHAEKV